MKRKEKKKEKKRESSKKRKETEERSRGERKTTKWHYKLVTVTTNKGKTRGKGVREGGCIEGRG